MNVRTPRRKAKVIVRARKDAPPAGESLAAVLDGLHLKLTAEDLVGALMSLQRTESTVDLPARDRAFWDTHSGISPTPRAVARGSANNAAAQLLMDSSSLTASDVAEKLHLSPSTVRHYKAERKLYSYLANGRLVFPDWQFTQKGDRALPGLDRVLSTLPDDLHPQAVAGFFLTPQPDLVMSGEAVPPAVWLEKGGSAEPVLAMAAALAAGY